MEHWDFDVFADLDNVLRVFDLVVSQFGDVQQAFQIVFQFDEHAEVGDLGDLALHDHARLIVGRDGFCPGVFGHLLQAQCNALLGLIDFEPPFSHLLNTF